jgi:adenylate cyclase
VIGDTVNLASRLEEMTKDLAPSILVSASTADLIAGRLPLTPIDQIDIRGKQAPVLVYAPSS